MIVLTNDALRRYLTHLTGHRPADGKLHLLGIRSARPYPAPHAGEVAISVQEPRENQYDDLLGFLGSDLGVFVGTVDPGRNWTLYPMQAGGCAHVADGGPYLQKIGVHKSKPAFVQAGPVKIWRDRDRDSVHDPSEKEHFETGNGIDVHRMGRAGPGVNSWSAGCLGAVASDWPLFWKRATAVRQPEYQLWVMDGWKFAGWHDGGQPA